MSLFPGKTAPLQKIMHNKPTNARRGNSWKIPALVFSASALAIIAALSWYSSAFISSSPRFVLRVAYLLTATHGSTAIKGKNGWLFYRPALVSAVKPWPRKTIENIIALNENLLRDSVSLLVVPVPDKNDVYPELLGLGGPPHSSPQWNRFFGDLKRAHVQYVDLFPALCSAKSHDTLFLKYDSHWNQNGILIAAGEITKKIREIAPSLSSSVVLTARDTAGHRYDDLYRILFNTAKDDEGPYRWQAVLDQNGRPYKSDPTAPIMVFGDSFINAGSDVDAELAGHIARFSGVRTRNFFSLMANIDGPSMLAAYLKKTKVRPKVVVWVFVSCQLMKEFSAP
jgi:hypothetical protein